MLSYTRDNLIPNQGKTSEKIIMVRLMVQIAVHTCCEQEPKTDVQCLKQRKKDMCVDGEVRVVEEYGEYRQQHIESEGS